MATKTGPIVTNDKGKHFDTPEAVFDYLRKNDYDLRRYSAIPNPEGDGFVGADIIELKKQKDDPKSKPKSVNPLDVGPYRWVTLQAIDQGDSEVFVGVNGTDMYFPVEEPVVVSDPFYQAIKTSKKTKFFRDGGELRRSTRPVQHYPTQDEKTATPEEFRKWMTEVYNPRRKARTGTAIAAGAPATSVPAAAAS